MVDDVDRTTTLSFTEGCFDRLDQPGAVVFPNDEAIEDDEEVRAFVECRLSNVVQIEHIIGGFNSREASREERLDEGRLVLGGGSRDWEEHHRPSVGPSFQEVVCNGVRLKGAGLLSAIWAGGFADFGKEQAQQVGDLRRCPYR